MTIKFNTSFTSMIFGTPDPRLLGGAQGAPGTWVQEVRRDVNVGPDKDEVAGAGCGRAQSPNDFLRDLG